MPKLNQRGVAHIFLILFLIVGLIVAVYLVKQKTNIIPKASGQVIEFSDNTSCDVEGKDCVAYDVNIGVQFLADSNNDKIYKYWVSTAPSDVVLPEQDWKTYQTSELTKTTVTLQNPEPNKLYYILVKFKENANAPDEDSAIHTRMIKYNSLQASCQPDKSFAVLKWDEVEGAATWYDITITDIKTGINIRDRINKTSYQFTPSATDETYKWTVRSLSSNEKKNNFMSGPEFTCGTGGIKPTELTLTPPAAPILLPRLQTESTPPATPVPDMSDISKVPVNLAVSCMTGNMAKLNWDSVPGATHYKIKVFPHNSEVINEQNQGDGPDNFVTTKGVRYDGWQVSACNSSDECSGYSFVGDEFACPK